MQRQMWSFPDEVGRVDVTGFSVEAVDGSVGKVEEAALEPGSSYLVIRAGAPILGRRALVPGGVVTRVDRDAETVHLGCSVDDVKHAPELDSERLAEAVYRDQVAGYYTSGAGARTGAAHGPDPSVDEDAVD